MNAGTWSPRRVAFLAMTQVAVLAVVGVAARSTSSEAAAVGDQIVWLDIAVAAAITSAAVNGSFLVRARRALSLRQQTVLASVDARAQLTLDTVSASTAASPTVLPVSVPGLRFAHRPDCPMVAGKRTVPAPAGQEPCGWCTR